MDKRIVFELADGSVVIRTPVEGSRKSDESEESWIERTAARHINKPKFKGFKRLPNCLISDLPISRRFRNCWRANSADKVLVDLPLARAQRMAEIRAERNQRFAALDAEWMKAAGQKNTAREATVEAVRQTLRDIPNGLKLDTIKTPEALEAFEPTWPVLK